MSDLEFGIEVPEADRLEQLQEAAPGIEPMAAQHDPPALDLATANPADVLEQQIEIPQDDDEDW